MPFKSEAQQKYMFANHPEIAKKWAKKHGTIKNKKGKKKSKKELKEAVLKARAS